jgi:hypothetical protein
MRRRGSTSLSGLPTKRLIFAISVVTIITVKSLHIWCAMPAFSRNEVLVWGPSFYSQDISLLLSLRALLAVTIPLNPRLRVVTVCTAAIWTAYLLAVAAVETSFYTLSGSEAHWRNVNVLLDASGGKMMLTAMMPFILALTLLVVTSLAVQSVCFELGRLGMETVELLLRSAHSKAVRGLQMFLDARTDKRGAVDDSGWKKGGLDPNTPRTNTYQSRTRQTGIGLLLAIPFISSIFRPTGNYPPSLSLPVPILPIAGFTSPTLTPADIVLSTTSGLSLCNLNATTVAGLPDFQWLPDGSLVDGFEDWSTPGHTHYDARSDPLKISNLEDELLPDLQKVLHNIKIRHMMLIFLESTRADVFPLRKESTAWKRLVQSYPTRSLAEEAEEVLGNFTLTAKYLTGGRGNAQGGQMRGRGALYATNAITTSSYTLKSIVGTLCGVTPMPADFGVERTNHIYQPCLPQIFRALNTIEQAQDKEEDGDGFSSFKWSNRFMQSVTTGFDRQDLLMPKLGYRPSELVTRKYLRGDSAKFGAVMEADVNYFGMPEVVLEKYIRDAFQSATDNEERLFLTHLTSTTHHPFETPSDDPQQLPDGSDHEDLVRYLGSIDYVDRWLKTILTILDEQKVANETLVVFVGDHGLSVAEDATITPYGAQQAANFHVPMIFSHPHLPNMRIDDAVISSQILPTILDLLQSTGSLPEQSKKAARDLIANYEGQSLLRPLRAASADTNHVVWQFAIVNPGGRTLLVRDARRPERRLFLPLADGERCRYTDLRTDPDETEPVLSFSYPGFLAEVEVRHGLEIKDWISEAVCAAQWWLGDSTKRWQGSTPRLND